MNSSDVIGIVGNIVGGLIPIITNAINAGDVSTLEAVQKILPSAATQKARDLALQNKLDREAKDKLGE